ncbi:heavy metal translocating P-type ATPase [Candidatus Entotheonella palauensis]|nr:heavy metal translocating P-type ATPase [Candidatus Entotheonella palauensis]
MSEEQLAANRRLKFSILLFSSIVTSALIYTPLVLLHIPFLLYLSFPFYKEGIQSLIVERRITTRLVDAILGIGALAYTPFHPPILIVGSAGSVGISYINKLIAKTKSGARRNLTNLLGPQPQTVWVVQGEMEMEIPFEKVQIGDVVVIDAGMMIPVDGRIQKGVGSIDQHKLTGEAQPAEKGVGDPVFAATVVLSGKIYIEVEKTGEETAAAQIGHILNETKDFTSSVQVRGRDIADRAAAPTLALSLLSLPLVGVNRALAILFSGVGYHMQILGPLSVLNFLQLLAHQGVVIKDGRALEQVRDIDTVVFDKTGTLTLEQPHVGAVHPYNGYSEADILTYAAAAEHRQTHPIAKAIQLSADERQLTLPTISDAAYEVGYGIKVRLDEKLIRVGSDRFMAMEEVTIPVELQSMANSAHEQGHSLVYVSIDDHLGGVLELCPTVRPEAKAVVDSLRQRGVEMYIISGDHERPTRALAEDLGIDHYFAETLPEHKADLIDQLQAEGRSVCFVGDGINDSIALKKANVSVSLRGASTVATDTAQVILMDQTLNQLDELFVISEHFESNMEVNLYTTIVPGVIIIGGAFLGMVGYGGSIVLFTGGLVAGLVNTALPLFRTQENGKG